MQHDTNEHPFKGEVPDLTAPPVLETPLRPARAARPIAVWIFLVVLLVLFSIAGVSAVSVFRFYFGLIDHWLRFLVAAIYSCIPHAITMALTAVLMYGAFLRKPWGRWVGLLVIATLPAWQLHGGGTAADASDVAGSGSFIVRFTVMLFLCIWWGYAFAFSRKAQQYFLQPVV